jgi:hypothetical protein
MPEAGRIFNKTSLPPPQFTDRKTQATANRQTCPKAAVNLDFMTCE